jgi:hypothetical protein
MLDNQIYQVLISTINQILVVQSSIYPVLQNALVRQSYQPTQQSVKNQPCVFVSKVTNPQFGWGINYIANTSEREQLQYAESTYQIVALLQQDPADVNSLTANDLVTLVSDMLQSYDIIRSLRAQGLAIQRVSSISGGHFANEKDRYELDPGFQVTFNYHRTYNKPIDHVDDAKGEIYGV